LNDQILIQGIKGRNKNAFDFVFTYYYSGLCAFAFRFVEDKQVAEDIVQEFFVTFWMQAPGIEIKSSLKTYMFSAIHHRCIDWHKHLKTVEKYRKAFLSQTLEPSLQPEEMIVESELRLAFQKGLEKCPPRCREIFIMNRITGLSNQQIAETLGLSKRTVELQISSALKVLRSVMRDYLPIWILNWLLS
jgi:RNA polymerase sigma-70 factor (ECF subfamily)